MVNAGQVSKVFHHIENSLYVLNLHDLLSDMSGGAKRKTVPAKLDLTEEQKSDIKEAFR